MLADRGLPSGCLDGWAVEPKLDGWRVRVLVSPPSGLQVLTRGGMDITERIPELRLLRRQSFGFVLDGELVADAGRADDFYAIQTRLRKRREAGSLGLSFVAFDVPWLDGNDLTRWPLQARRRLLEALELPEGVTVTRQWPGPVAPRLLEYCAALGVEGVVLKRLTSPYVPGRRSPDWRKVKVATWSSEHLPRRSSEERQINRGGCAPTWRPAR